MIAPDVLWHSLDRFAAERPNKLALSDEEGSISYADLPAEIHRDFPGALFCPCGMASQQRDDELPFGVEHQNGRILLLALDSSCN